MEGSRDLCASVSIPPLNPTYLRIQCEKWTLAWRENISSLDLTTHLYMEPRLRMSVVIFPLSCPSQFAEEGLYIFFKITW